MGNLFTSIKEKALEVSATAYINRKIRNFGKVKRLEINSERARLHIEAELAGETAPVVIDVGSYELLRENDLTFITLREITCSKEWLGAVLTEYVGGTKLQIPNVLGATLSDGG